MSNYVRKIMFDISDTLASAFNKLSAATAKRYRHARGDIDGAMTIYLDADNRFVPSIAERAMGDVRFRRTFLLDKEGWNETHKVISNSGMSIYKPASGEYLSNSMSIYFPQKSGEYAKREVAAYRVNELLGFDLVPPTAMVDGPKGLGSNQKFVPSRRAADTDKYDDLQMQQMAVLDYIIGNLDRLTRNYLVAPNGDLVAIDHGNSFPEKRGIGIRSVFVDKLRDQALDTKVLEHVDAVDPMLLRAALRDLELSDKAIDGAVERLNEIKSQRKITGNNWLMPKIEEGYLFKKPGDNYPISYKKF
ncbi:hypothetical protein AB0B25_09970 [Nocardia sp. NPDC049190]|uniref:hypothetical protein n=1 Tax=Nocardia sp. NPDC049190 TaxID=3155650 RepID=UPI0033C8E9B6